MIFNLISLTLDFYLRPRFYQMASVSTELTIYCSYLSSFPLAFAVYTVDSCSLIGCFVYLSSLLTISLLPQYRLSYLHSPCLFISFIFSSPSFPAPFFFIIGFCLQILMFFLIADSRIDKRLCLSVRPSVSLSSLPSHSLSSSRLSPSFPLPFVLYVVDSRSLVVLFSLSYLVSRNTERGQKPGIGAVSLSSYREAFSSSRLSATGR